MMRRWRWSSTSFATAGLGTATICFLVLRMSGLATAVTAAAVGLVLSFEENKDRLVLPRRVWKR